MAILRWPTKQMRGAMTAQQSIQKYLRQVGIGILISVTFVMKFLKIEKFDFS